MLTITSASITPPEKTITYKLSENHCVDLVLSYHKNADIQNIWPCIIMAIQFLTLCKGKGDIAEWQK